MILHKRFYKGLAVLTASAIMCMNAPNLQAKDYIGHWAEEALYEWTSLGIIKGYEDGTIRPSKAITRAELAAILDRVFGLNYKGSTLNYKDVKEGAWYGQAVQKVMAAQLMNDYEDEFRPNQLATREEAAYALARAYHLSGRGELSFVDSSLVSDWAQKEVEALIASGHLKGKGNGKLAPKDALTRAEVVTLLDRLTAKLYQNAGTYTENISGNVVINTSDVILKDMTISGNLYIAEGVGEGDVTLDNIKVEGHVIIEGGGEHSVEIKGSTLKHIYVEKASGAVRVALDQASKVAYVQVHSAAQLEGTIENLQVSTQEAVQLVGASIEQLEVSMAGGKVNVDQTSVIEQLVVDAAATISGKGKINKTLINADHVVLEGVTVDKDKITISSGVTVKPVINPSSGQTSGGSTGGSGSGSGSTTKPEGEEESGDVTQPEGGEESEGETKPEGEEESEDEAQPEGGEESGDEAQPEGEEESKGDTQPEDGSESEDVTKPEGGTESGEETPSEEPEQDGEESEEEAPSEDEESSEDDTEESGQVVESIQLSDENKGLLLGEEAVLTATVSPVEAAEESIVWTSSQPKIVSVDQNGKIIAKGIGEAIIKASTQDGTVSAECVVQVTGSTLSGKITVEESDVEGIQVLLYSEENQFEESITTVEANAEGEYKFQDLAKGNYRIQALYESETADYASILSDITIDEAVKNVDMSCEKATSLTVGVVDFKEPTKPVLYVRIVVEGKDAQGQTWRMADFTNGAGEAKFILPHNIEGEITYTVKKDGYEEMTYTYQVEELAKNKVEVAFKKEGEKVYPEIIEHYLETEGTNTKGLGDTTYEVLKQAGWRVESDTVLSTNSRRLKFENMNGVDGMDAKITYDTSGFEEEILDYDMILHYMIRKQSDATIEDLSFEDLKQMIANGSGEHKDGHRIIEVHYDGKVDGIVEIIFYNYGTHDNSADSNHVTDNDNNANGDHVENNGDVNGEHVEKNDDAASSQMK